MTNILGLSPLGFGAWEAGGGTTWGTNHSTDEVIAAVHAAVDGGVNWVDTAEVYGGGGGSERIVGMALADLPEVKVCTKVAPEVEEHFTAAGLRPALEASLERLGRDRVDAYLLHWPSETTPLAQTWEALLELKAEGVVGAIGLSNFPLTDIKTCVDAGGMDYLQVQGSVLYRDELAAFGSVCQENEIGLMAYGALGFGLLSGTVDADTTFADWRGGVIMAEDFFCADNYPRLFAEGVRERHLEVVTSLRAIAADLGASLPQLAIAWLLARPECVTALVGTRNPVHAAENAAAAAMTLTEEQVRRIDDLLGSRQD